MKSLIFHCCQFDGGIENSVALSNELVKALDIGCRHFHFNVVVTSPSCPEWDGSGRVWKQIEECFTVIKRYNFVLCSMDDVYRASVIGKKRKT